MEKTSDFKTILDLAQQLIQSIQMPLYGDKHSQKTFTSHQLFKLMIIKSFLGLDYRRFEDFLKTSKIPEYLEMKRIPHYTTLQKFAKRQSIKDLEKMLVKFVKLHDKNIKNVGFDATGFTLSHSSKHYEKRIEKPILKKDFMKANFFYDLDNLMILGVKMRKKSRHDTKDLHSMWNKIKHLDFQDVYADKAYDANWFHELIFESGKKSKIHLKQENIPIHKTKGHYRKHMKRHQKNSQKGIRSLCETINSMIKKIFDSVIRARNWTTQKIELFFKIIAFNLERVCKINKNIFVFILFFLLFFDFESKYKRTISDL
jgi:hypothetical protein